MVPAKLDLLHPIVELHDEGRKSRVCKQCDVGKSLVETAAKCSNDDNLLGIPLDGAVTAIDLTSATPIQVARGSAVTDSDGTRRAMRATYQRELDGLESHLSFLATVGSVSPYVGLFGTVWGIMLAFQGLATVAQATLAQVAPGIAEALIATAMGLFSAIPAVVGYNRYTHDIDRLANRMESFMEEFSNILQRQSIKPV